MSDELYRLILKGYSGNKGEYYVELDFAEVFKISTDKAKEMFQSAPTTLKKNLSLEKANKYKSRVEKLGAVCEVESMKFDFIGLSLED